MSFGQSTILSWQYNSNAIWQAQQMGWPVWFKIYGTNQPFGAVTNWQLIVAQNATNYTVIASDPTNQTFSYTSTVAPGQFFYVATASNFWGESGPSNTSGVPSLPFAVHTTIQKGP